jgi:hypothetical protein
MSTTLLYAGLACTIGAIVGGGLEAFGIKVPIFHSLGRQTMLGAFGVILLVGSFRVSDSTPAVPPLPKKCESTYVRQPYTTEGDGRVSKSLSCPEGMIVTPGSAKCLTTANSVAKSSSQVGDNTWVCVWDSLPIGVGMWVEMGCQCK